MRLQFCRRRQAKLIDPLAFRPFGTASIPTVEINGKQTTRPNREKRMSCFVKLWERSRRGAYAVNDVRRRPSFLEWRHSVRTIKGY